ncbi:hypothetical protein DIPPA_07028 [Diplonema papillatum]|nr:hypothetical protein DIPPA_07028 [Diplonema papillatum]
MTHPAAARAIGALRASLLRGAGPELPVRAEESLAAIEGELAYRPDKSAACAALATLAAARARTRYPLACAHVPFLSEQLLRKPAGSAAAVSLPDLAQAAWALAELRVEGRLLVSVLKANKPELLTESARPVFSPRDRATIAWALTVTRAPRQAALPWVSLAVDHHRDLPRNIDLLTNVLWCAAVLAVKTERATVLAAETQRLLLGSRRYVAFDAYSRATWASAALSHPPGELFDKISASPPGVQSPWGVPPRAAGEAKRSETSEFRAEPHFFPRRAEGRSFPPRAENHSLPPRAENHSLPTRADNHYLPPRAENHSLPGGADNHSLPPRAENHSLPGGAVRAESALPAHPAPPGRLAFVTSLRCGSADFSALKNLLWACRKGAPRHVAEAVVAVFRARADELLPDLRRCAKFLSVAAQLRLKLADPVFSVQFHRCAGLAASPSLPNSAPNRGLAPGKDRVFDAGTGRARIPQPPAPPGSTLPPQVSGRAGEALGGSDAIRFGGPPGHPGSSAPVLPSFTAEQLADFVHCVHALAIGGARVDRPAVARAMGAHAGDLAPAHVPLVLRALAGHPANFAWLAAAFRKDFSPADAAQALQLVAKGRQGRADGPQGVPDEAVAVLRGQCWTVWEQKAAALLRNRVDRKQLFEALDFFEALLAAHAPEPAPAAVIDGLLQVFHSCSGDADLSTCGIARALAFSKGQHPSVLKLLVEALPSSPCRARLQPADVLVLLQAHTTTGTQPSASLLKQLADGLPTTEPRAVVTILRYFRSLRVADAEAWEGVLLSLASCTSGSRKPSLRVDDLRSLQQLAPTVPREVSPLFLSILRDLPVAPPREPRPRTPPKPVAEPSIPWHI